MARMLVPRYNVSFSPWESFLSEWARPFFSTEEYEEWLPSSDIAETEEAYLVTMEMPGIDMEKTDISYNDGILTVKGEKRKESTEGECCYCAERYSGPFQRSFRIPVKVENDKIDASYKDGILKLTLPKAEESKPKKITVH